MRYIPMCHSWCWRNICSKDHYDIFHICFLYNLHGKLDKCCVSLGELVVYSFCFIMYIYVPSSGLWCPSRFPHEQRGSGLYLQLFVGGIMSYLRCLCLLAYRSFKHILCCHYVIAPFVFSNDYLLISVKLFDYHRLNCPCISYQLQNVYSSVLSKTNRNGHCDLILFNKPIDCTNR